MKSSASFRLHAKPSITKTPSQESKNESSSQGSQSETSKVASTSSSTSNECFVPLPQGLLQQPLEDFDLSNKNVSLTIPSDLRLRTTNILILLSIFQTLYDKYVFLTTLSIKNSPFSKNTREVIEDTRYTFVEKEA